MARILGVIVILAAIAGIVAYKLEWISFSRDGSSVKATVDKDKAKEDIKEGVKTVEDDLKKAGTNVMEAIKPTKK
jgi:hypothetical protein